MATDIVTSQLQILDATGVPVSGAKVYVYEVNTTTLRDIFNDTGLASVSDNPIICDSSGRHDMRYTATGSYKIVVKSSADVTLYTRDDIDGGLPAGGGGASVLDIANGGTNATTASQALSNLGGVTSTEFDDLSTEVATLAGVLSATDKTHIATGDTASRPDDPEQGDFRRNSQLDLWEGYRGSEWQFFTMQGQPSSVGAWARITFNGGATPSIDDSSNVSSIVDHGIGDVEIIWNANFSNANYACVATLNQDTTLLTTVFLTDKTTDSIRVKIKTATASGNATMTGIDLDFAVVAFGTYA